jgi:hypothetical protein
MLEYPIDNAAAAAAAEGTKERRNEGNQDMNKLYTEYYFIFPWATGRFAF